MNTRFTLLFAGFMVLSCQSNPVKNERASIGPVSDFHSELEAYRAFFHIPGMAAIVMDGDEIIYENYFGYADLENKQPMDSTTTIPMASLTKMFSATLVMKAAEGTDLLNEPIANYISDKSVPDSIKVRHVMSHTSQGDVGKHFYYSYRFGWLTDVIEKKYKSSFSDAMRKTIIEPLRLQNTYLLENEAQLTNESRKIAKPYFYEGATKPGFIDFGATASSGIASTVRDMARFGRALDTDKVLSTDMRAEMFNPHAADSVYGYGFFVQHFGGEKIIWAYGQYDCYSSLFIKVKDLTCVIAANNSLMSDPARMIYGDVTTSGFAMSFLYHYAVQNGKVYYPLKLTKASAVWNSFLGRYDSTKVNMSDMYLRNLFKLYRIDQYDDLTTMHTIVFLKEIAANRGTKIPDDFDPQLTAIGSLLLERDRSNPYANYYMGRHYDLKGNADSARFYYRRIVKAKNFSVFWYTHEAENWLKEHP